MLSGPESSTTGVEAAASLLSSSGQSLLFVCLFVCLFVLGEIVHFC